MVPSPSHFKAPPPLQSPPPPSPAMTHGESRWGEVWKHGSREKREDVETDEEQ